MACKSCGLAWKERVMNETNELEARLRAWTPRPPSRSLKAQIFRPARGQSPLTSSTFRLLGPAHAAVLLLCGLFNQRQATIIAVATQNGSFVTGGLSNQSSAAFLPCAFQPEANCPPADTFEWTNARGSSLSIPFFSSSRAKTN